MKIFSPSFQDVPPGAGIFNPYNLISYAGSLGALVLPLLYWWSGVKPWTLSSTIGLLGVLLFLLCTLLMGHLAPRNFGSWLHEPKRLRGRFLLFCYLIALLCAVWGFRDYSQPILLCALAATSIFLAPRSFWLPFLLLTNILVVTLYLQAWSFYSVLIFILFYVLLQCFIVLAMHNLLTVIHTRRNAQRINQELLATRQLLEESTRAEERLRLSRELHDVAGHKLTALKLQLMLAIQQGYVSQKTLTDCGHLADELLHDIRGVVSTLRENEGVDLQSALRALDLGLKNPVLHFELDPMVRIADTKRAHALLHCAQEGFTNALRHSAAKNIWIRLVKKQQQIVLSVEDDGRGIHQPLRYGNGLTGLAERLAEIDGSLSVQLGSNRGTVLYAILLCADEVVDVYKLSTVKQSSCFLRRIEC